MAATADTKPRDSVPASVDLFRRMRRRWRRARSKPSPVTLEGTIFIVLMLLIGAAATNTGTNLLYLIFCLMAAFLLVSGFLSTRNMKKIRVARSLPKHIVAGQPVDIRVTVRNRKRLFASYGLQLTDWMDDDTAGGHSYFVRIPPREEGTVSYSCTFNRRGTYQFSHFVVSTSYPFGLICRSIVVPLEREVLVYPQVLPWQDLGLQAPPDFGEQSVRRKGVGTSLFGIREQHPSEGARWVHWKKTAQLDRLMRREFEAEEKKNVSLLLDNGLVNPDDPDQLEAFERAVIMTASVAHHMLRADHQVELVTRSGRVPLSSGPHQRHRILRALALIEPVSAEGRKPLRLGARGDTATILFHCNGEGASAGTYPRGTHICAISPPSEQGEATDGSSGRAGREAAR